MKTLHTLCQYTNQRSYVHTRTSVEPLIAGEENVSEVPGPTEPVFVIVRGWFAVKFSSPTQPVMNEPAIARTSLGLRAISNA